VKLLIRIYNLLKKLLRKMAKINDTSAYALATPPLSANSLLLGSLLAGGDTVNFLLSDVSDYVQGIIGIPTLADVCASGNSTGTAVGIADTLTLSKATGTGLSITANATVGGTLGVVGTTTLTGAIDANSTADIADTLTLSKPTGTGLAITSNAVISGTVEVTGSTTVTGLLKSNKPTGVGLQVDANATVGGELKVDGNATVTGLLKSDKPTGVGLQVDADADVHGLLWAKAPTGTGLKVTADAGISGGLDVTGALDANSTADIADTLTLSKATGTGLDVVADASIGGTLTMGIGDGVVTNQITAPTGANIAFYMGGVQRGAFIAPLGGFGLSYGLTVSAGLTTLQDTLFQGGLYTTPDTPASASASGTAGQISVDANYIYVCTATNTWKRVAIATW
jgi:hypothetical protein